jgi:hypothetical protein
MPEGINSVLNNKDFLPDELSMAIIEGLCDQMFETIKDCPEGQRMNLCFSLKG